MAALALQDAPHKKSLSSPWRENWNWYPAHFRTDEKTRGRSCPMAPARECLAHCRVPWRGPFREASPGKTVGGNETDESLRLVVAEEIPWRGSPKGHLKNAVMSVPDISSTHSVKNFNLIMIYKSKIKHLDRESWSKLYPKVSIMGVRKGGWNESRFKHAQGK